MSSIDSTLNTGYESLPSGLACDTGQTGSDVLPEALAQFAMQSQRTTETNMPEMDAPVAGGPYTLISDLVGIGAGGPPDIARNQKTVMRKDSITPKNERSLAPLRDKDFSLRSK
uniref:Uncharacterized protein n=1 Tax=Candidatus Kentrum sp. DK TaxID=2126562 RepID=A0A450TL65_9GAMM|nr:MAG: hypothetical protein BECKDK2373C_GA0170839_11842 [Candidatus Kentron sp. DK]